MKRFREGEQALLMFVPPDAPLPAGAPNAGMIVTVEQVNDYVPGRLYYFAGGAGTTDYPADYIVGTGSMYHRIVADRQLAKLDDPDAHTETEQVELEEQA